MLQRTWKSVLGFVCFVLVYKAIFSCSYYLGSRSINERTYHSRRYVDEYRNDYMGCEPGYYYGEHESRYQNHSSKSSGRSGRSSYKSKHRIHHSSSHRRSHGVCTLFNLLEVLFPTDRKQICVEKS